jgi:hypothetical protein
MRATLSPWRARARVAACGNAVDDHLADRAHAGGEGREDRRRHAAAHSLREVQRASHLGESGQRRRQRHRTEQSRHRRAVDVARAQLAALTARRQVLLAEGGNDLARQLRDLNGGRTRLQAELADAEELFGLARNVVDERRAAARHEVEGYRNTAWCDAVRAAREREEQLRAKLAERSRPRCRSCWRRRRPARTCGTRPGRRPPSPRRASTAC